MPSIAEVENGLSEAARDLWIRTVLAVIGTEPQRYAFIDGYNGQPLAHRGAVSVQMREKYALGQQVRAHLEESNG